MLINNALNFCIQFYTGLFGYLFERRLCDRKCIALKIVKKPRYKKSYGKYQKYKNFYIEIFLLGDCRLNIKIFELYLQISLKVINSVKFLPYPVEREAANENNKFSNKILKIIDIVIYVVFDF